MSRCHGYISVWHVNYTRWVEGINKLVHECQNDVFVCVCVSIVFVLFIVYLLLESMLIYRNLSFHLLVPRFHQSIVSYQSINQSMFQSVSVIDYVPI